MAEDQYGDHHRHFLQSLMSHRICSSSQVLQIYREACARVGMAADRHQLVTFVSTLNNRLIPLGLRVAKGCSERDGSNFYALINVVDDPLAASCACYTEQQLRYLLQLLDQLVPAEGEGCSVVTAVNMAAGSRLETERFLDQLVDDCWLERCRDAPGRLLIHTRTLIELGGWMSRRYGDHLVRACGLCTRYTLYGTRCGRCEEKFHTPCLGRFQKKLGRPACAKCKQELTVT